MDRTPRRALAALTLAFLVAGCGAEDPPAGAEARPDRGDLRVVFDRPADADARRGLRLLSAEADLRGTADAINAQVALPRDIRVRVGGTDGPFYDPERAEIVFPPTFALDLLDVFEGDEESVGLVSDFVLLHEIGHALIDQLDLPATGREEDAADELATVVSTEVLDDEDLALAAAEWFDLSAAQRDELTEDDVFDEHALDEQRFFTIACHVYGSDPEAFADLAAQAELPREQLDRCPDEYEQKVDAWTTLLDPWLKD